MLSPEICEQARLSRDPRFDGLFFILVNTTKIFCRNTCRVRAPLAHNVSFAMSAQQAMAQGYRPCLRCRPDSAPMSFAWQGVNTTVQRAMKLLSERLFDSVEDTANRLGISARYLNKLFQDNLKMSAKRYKLYQQVLQAKSLLQQTDMSIEDVAFNVGFMSARQLQVHVKDYLRLTPSDIRKNKATAGMRLNENVRLLLPYRPPYNWQQVREFFAKRMIEGNERVDKNSLFKVLRVPTRVRSGYSDSLANELKSAYVEVPVTITHTPEQTGFTVEFAADYARHALAITPIIRRLLDLDADPQIIAKALKRAGLLPDEIVSGLRIPGVASEFEAGCRAILGQQVSVKAAINKLNTLYSHFAQGDSAAFTLPAILANDPLEFLKMPGARKQSLIDFARYYAELDLKLNAETQNAVTQNAVTQNAITHNIDKLIDIKGVGPWTVNYIKMRAACDTDVWLSTDLIIKQQATKLLASGRRFEPENAAPWRSYLTLNLWQLSA